MVKTLAMGAATVALSALITAGIVFAQTPSPSSSATMSPSVSSSPSTSSGTGGVGGTTTVPGAAPSTGHGG